MAGHTGTNDKGEYEGLLYLPITAENNFTAEIPVAKVDLIYLCFLITPRERSPREHLKAWVDYARAHNSIIFDAAYEAFITDPEIPHSIYEIDGARECAIEFRSFQECWVYRNPLRVHSRAEEPYCDASDGTKVEMWKLWNRRQSTKFNGVSYIVQREPRIYSESGQAQIKALQLLSENAKIIRETDSSRIGGVWGRECALRLGENAQ